MVVAQLNPWDLGAARVPQPRNTVAPTRDHPPIRQHRDREYLPIVTAQLDAAILGAARIPHSHGSVSAADLTPGQSRLLEIWVSAARAPRNARLQ